MLPEMPEDAPVHLPSEAATADPVRRPGGFPRALLDEHALTVVRRLRRFGHEAYLVGGSVRDLLSGLEPKDFDVVTDARPNRIKRLFRNARIIGRRFRLAHIRFGKDVVIETSTFRRAPPGDEALPDEGAADGREAETDARGRRRRSDLGAENIFGTAPEDARRRDFTINALFYDPLDDEILDWVGGLDDLARQVVRSIGDPVVRMHEDPVRMIRAAHFEQRMGFRIEPTLEEAIRRTAPILETASQARLYVELLKVLVRGHARSTLIRLQELGVLRHWLPELAEVLEAGAEWPGDRVGTHDEAVRGEPESIPVGHATWNLLGAADRWGPGAHGAEDALALAPLLGPWLVDAWREAGRPRSHHLHAEIVEERLRPLALRMSMPKRTQARLRDLLWLWPELRSPPRRDAHVNRLVRRPAFSLALGFLRLDLMSRDCPLDVLEAWEALLPSPASRPPEDHEPERRGRGRTRNRRRRSGRPREPHSGIRSEANAWAPAPEPEGSPSGGRGRGRRRRKGR